MRILVIQHQLINFVDNCDYFLPEFLSFFGCISSCYASFVMGAIMGQRGRELCPPESLSRGSFPLLISVHLLFRFELLTS